MNAIALSALCNCGKATCKEEYLHLIILCPSEKADIDLMPFLRKAVEDLGVEFADAQGASENVMTVSDTIDFTLVLAAQVGAIQKTWEEKENNNAIERQRRNNLGGH
jgi:hypothetical protein